MTDGYQCNCTWFLTAGWCAAGSQQCNTERRLEAIAYAINAQYRDKRPKGVRAWLT